MKSTGVRWRGRIRGIMADQILGLKFGWEGGIRKMVATSFETLFERPEKYDKRGGTDLKKNRFGKYWDKNRKLKGKQP